MHVVGRYTVGAVLRLTTLRAEALKHAALPRTPARPQPEAVRPFPWPDALQKQVELVLAHFCVKPTDTLTPALLTVFPSSATQTDPDTLA